uniref:SAP domain-containing protein n=2 Tax=Arion vulgaris TaxID=1028688 RepID=A0A0B7A2V0_9EUPU
MSDIDPDSLKVAELREQLKTRGLDTKGNKASLVSRLKEAMDAAGEEYVGGGEYAGGEEGEQEEEEEEEEQMDEAGDGTANFDEEGDQGVVGATEGESAEQPEANGNAEDEEAAVVLGDEFRTIDEATQDDTEEGNTDRKRRRSRSRDRHRPARSRSRDRHRRDRRSGRYSPPHRKVEMEDTAWESLTIFNLDKYDSDLNLRFNERGIKAYPLTVDGFAFMWCGVRATYGVLSGKVAYEAKILENLKVNHLPKDESNPHVLRLGWSVNSTSRNLGEEPLSFGYGGSGKASTENKFVDYGQAFTQGDVITAYLDLESDPIVISYAKNGEDLGTCFEIEKEKLGDQAVFPHLMTKNTEFEVNFGGREGPYFPLKEGYKFLEQVPLEERVRGHLPPATKETCEVIMMVGLPGAGKTYWVDNYVASNPDKLFNVLGTNNIIDKMKVNGLPRKQNYSGRWSVLIDMSAKCLSRMIEIASHKKRNYIIDQTNVYASARRRKMQPFEGFLRKAVVVLPTDEVFKKRVKERTDEEGKDIPDSAVNEMKVNFTLPEKGECYETVEYTETDLTKEEREKLIEKYRREGHDALPPPDKRYRRESRDFREYRVGRRSGYRGSFRRGRRSGFRSRSRSRGFSSYRPYSERRARGGYRGSFREDRRRDDRRESYSSFKRPRGAWGSSGDWGAESWGGSGYRRSKWSGYNDDYDRDRGWDDYDQVEGYGQEWDGYEDEQDYDQGSWGYGYK